jgi:hypothetical protein
VQAVAQAGEEQEAVQVEQVLLDKGTMEGKVMVEMHPVQMDLLVDGEAVAEEELLQREQQE